MRSAAVCFDLDDTLFDHRGAARAGARRFLGDLGVDVDEAVLAEWSGPRTCSTNGGGRARSTSRSSGGSGSGPSSHRSGSRCRPTTRTRRALRCLPRRVPGGLAGLPGRPAAAAVAAGSRVPARALDQRLRGAAARQADRHRPHGRLRRGVRLGTDRRAEARPTGVQAPRRAARGRSGVVPLRRGRPREGRPGCPTSGHARAARRPRDPGPRIFRRWSGRPSAQTERRVDSG